MVALRVRVEPRTRRWIRSPRWRGLRLVFLLFLLVLAVPPPSGRRWVGWAAPVERSLVLRAAPQDGHAYLAWSPVEGATGYVVRWKPADADGWAELDAGGATRALVPGLGNGRTYHFVVAADGPDPAESNLAAARPSAPPPPDYAGRACQFSSGDRHIFCSQAAMDGWLADNGIDPGQLRCRNRALGAWRLDAPNCWYEVVDAYPFQYPQLARELFPTHPVWAAPAEPLSPATVRRVARQLIWGGGDPFADPARRFPLVEQTETDPGAVVGYAGAQAYAAHHHWRLSGRAVRFVPPDPQPGLVAIYHEGHGRGLHDGAETVSWLLARGWEVWVMDMPMLGQNLVDFGGDVGISIGGHGGLEHFDDGTTSPLSLFLLPVKSVVDRIDEDRGPGRGTLMMIGRSGGGLTTYLYSALDPRVDVAVNLAGGIPLSQAWRSGLGWPDLGDYEQFAAHLFDVVGHEDLMAAAGARGSLHVYGSQDPCCYRIAPGTEQARFLGFLEEYGRAFGKRNAAFIDPAHGGHGIGPAGYAVLDAFLAELATPDDGKRSLDQLRSPIRELRFGGSIDHGAARDGGNAG